MPDPQPTSAAAQPAPTRLVRWSLAIAEVSLRLASALPPEWAWHLGNLLGHAVAQLPLRDVRRCREHLAMAFPDRPAEWHARTAMATWRHFGGTALWTLTTARRDPRQLRKGVMVEGPDNLRHLVRRSRAGQPTMVFSGHFGNWELLPRVMGTFLFHTVIGRRLRSPVADALILGLRGSSGARIVYQDEDLRALMRDLRNGRPVATLNDQNIERLDGCFVPWFGHPAYTPLAPAALAQIARADVVAAFLVRRHRRWVIHASPPLTVPRTGDRLAQQVALTAAITAYEETLVRAAPHQWVWWHRRWRTTQNERPGAPRVPN